ncbi:hypothetical protein MPH_14003 [Macrophomina phaseolina MS6]|uniref:Uncharacterized protein n=1 Tax=Macrophomina phaseolina (strain MS6) TaxID=1126212 RepID=K2R7Z8_MACPH|nr:hypothetical protein MPH_14003 [Macrophomina phaseolina MS6]
MDPGIRIVVEKRGTCRKVRPCRKVRLYRKIRPCSKASHTHFVCSRAIDQFDIPLRFKHQQSRIPYGQPDPAEVFNRVQSSVRILWFEEVRDMKLPPQLMDIRTHRMR